MNIRTVKVIFPKKKPHSKEYKFMTWLLKTLHILFGLDFGFFADKSLKFRFILNLLSFIHCVGLVVFIFVGLRNNEMNLTTIWTALYFLEYLLTILLLLSFKRGTTFMDLQESLEEIDDKLDVNFMRNRPELKFILTILLIIIERIILSGLYCYFSSVYCWYTVYTSAVDSYVFVFLNSCVDISLACYSFVFYSLSSRLAKLASMLETSDDVESVQRLYKTIIDTVEKYKKAFDPVYMLLLLMNVPQVMASTLFTLRDILGDRVVNYTGWVVEYIYVLEVFILTIAPALTAEMLTTQAEKIKTILHDKRLLTGIQHKGSIKQFIQYVEARPCRFRVWKLIPLSADLLGIVLSFCATYLIVIIQFTNLK